MTCVIKKCNRSISNAILKISDRALQLNFGRVPTLVDIESKFLQYRSNRPGVIFWILQWRRCVFGVANYKRHSALCARFEAEKCADKNN